jgi:hypothetical protein
LLTGMLPLQGGHVLAKVKGDLYLRGDDSFKPSITNPPGICRMNLNLYGIWTHRP